MSDSFTRMFRNSRSGNVWHRVAPSVDRSSFVLHALQPRMSQEQGEGDRRLNNAKEKLTGIASLPLSPVLQSCACKTSTRCTRFPRILAGGACEHGKCIGALTGQERAWMHLEKLAATKGKLECP